MMTPNHNDVTTVTHVRDAIMSRQRFVVTSHARPDGDAIGSQLAMALALQYLGKAVRVTNRDAPPAPYRAFAGVNDIEVAEAVAGEVDAVIIMECSDLTRPDLAGLDGRFIINIDHHDGNTVYGQLNWFDVSAAACGEMVFDLILALGVPLTRDIATHIYLAILTDTGSFHHGPISARTFDTCRRLAEAGVDAAAMARSVFDTGTPGRLKLIGALLNRMQLEAGGRISVLYLDDAMLRETGGTYDDLEGVINLPLSARDVLAVIFFKASDEHPLRISLRSKGAINVRAVAAAYGGGGHMNAAGFTAPATLQECRDTIVTRVTDAIDAVGTTDLGSAAWGTNAPSYRS